MNKNYDSFTEFFSISENKKQADMYLQQGKLPSDVHAEILRIDKSPTKKFAGWFAKQWVANQIPDIDTLRNTFEEFLSFYTKGKISKKDIYQYQSFGELKQEVDHLNQSGEGFTAADLENDFETILDNDKLLVMVPHTHQASRKLGLSHFSYRDCGEGRKDSAWCTTYKAPNHFNDYYFKHNITFYYVKVRSPEIIQHLERDPEYGPQFVVVALAVLSGEHAEQAQERGMGNIDAYDALDKQFTGEKLQKYLQIIGLK